jgi:3-oxoisoapionate kinase
MKDGLPKGPLLAFYGDDFTGSTAVLEALAFAGLKTILFFDTPTEAMVKRAGDCAAIGVAGLSRAKSPHWMEQHLPAAFHSIEQFGAPLNHYKICSTFDSAPHIGSIGKAIDIGRAHFKSEAVPVFTAAPIIGRWQIFGNLFARIGQEVFRIDRHPVMMRHPVTPMDEADLVSHLSKQTDATIGLVNWIELTSGQGEICYRKLVEHNSRIILLDGLDDETLIRAGELMWERRSHDRFVAGSQGVNYALIAYWRSKGMIEQHFEAPKLTRVERIAAVSGSCSIITAKQIQHAANNGFVTIRAQSLAVLDEQNWAQEITRCTELAVQALADGKDALIFTAEGPDDPEVKQLEDVMARNKLDREGISHRLGSGLGQMLDRIVERAHLTRAVVSGGDSSGQACLAMGLTGVTAAATLEPSAPLCRALSDKSYLNGLEIALKGGQMGSVDFLTKAKGDNVTH